MTTLPPVTPTPLRQRQTRVVDGVGATLRWIADARIVTHGLSTGQYKLLDKRGAWARCVRDMTAQQPRQTAALSSVYRVDSPTYLSKRAVGTRADYVLVKWGRL